MTDQEFAATDAKLLEQSNATLLNRKQAYAQDGDRLANFKETALATGLTPEKVCEVYLYKALSAMLKILHGSPAVGETVLERFGDSLNYVRLAFALHQEKAKSVDAYLIEESTAPLSSLIDPLYNPFRKPFGMRLGPIQPREHAANRYVD